ncbi:hypothetical protein HYW17_00815 [Candidatus Uhrbacteria bacterium]|nr:hypothetical protein [Candidatus Uhrbacteria bacterium]
MFKGLAQNATKIVGVAALAVTIGYILMLLALPLTTALMGRYFGVPESAGVNPYLAKAITLTFGFLAAWLITKYMLGWSLLNKKILAFAGIVAVFILYYFVMWGMTTAPARKQANEMQEQIKAQKTQVAQKKEQIRTLKGELQQGVALLGEQQKACGKEMDRLGKEGTAAREAAQTASESAAQRQQELEQCMASAQALQASTQEERDLHVKQTTQCREEVTQLMAQLTEAQTGKKECTGQVESLRHLVVEVTARARENERRAEVQAMGTQTLTASLQPAVYTSPAAPLPPEPEPKAQVVFAKDYQFNTAYNCFFTVVLQELAGVDVLFSGMEVKIWRMDSTGESLAEVKKRAPHVFREEPLALPLAGNSSWSPADQAKLGRLFTLHNLSGKTVPHLCLDKYDYWLQGDEWIEVRLNGRDANGHPQEILLSGAD